MKITELKHIHFVGIKGVGMTSLALCAQDLGIKVTGSDIPELFITDKVLKERGIVYKTSFSPENLLPKPDLVITTGAHGGLNNIEVSEAVSLGIPVLTQGAALAEFAKGKKIIAVCGVGGKTTISSMIAFVLEKTGSHPSYAVGVSEIFGLGYGGKFDKEGEYFVAEADEYVVSPGVDNRPKFHLLSPNLIVTTNIKHDHPDIYPTEGDTKRAYQDFFEKLSKDGVLLLSADDKNSTEISKEVNAKVLTYGVNEDSDLQITERKTVGKAQEVMLTLKERSLVVKMKLKVPGEYNARNIAATFLACMELGLNAKEIAGALEDFSGTKRRFEIVGETKGGAIIIDDYAHHPSEIQNLIRATREFYPEKKITVAFQPHTYSRTKALFDDFAKALSLADKVCLVDIYSSAREAKDESVSSEKLAEAVKKLNKNTFYIGNLKESAKWLKENTKGEEVLLTVGAGDIFYIHKEIIN